MSSAMKGKKHEYLTLKVDEIAVVDDAANLKEFAVIKSKTTQEGDEKMPQEKEVKKEEKVLEVELKEEDSTEEKDKTVRKALVSIDAVVSEVLKSIEDEKETEETEEKKTEEAKTEKSEDKTEEETEEKPEESTEEKPEANVEVDTEKMLDSLVASMQKAKSLTPDRIEALKKVKDALTGFFSEIEPEKKEEVEKSKEKEEKPEVDLSEIKKLIEDKVNEVIETTKSLDGRVKEIEKARTPSASLDEEGETETVEKSDPDFWSGVPIGQ